MRNKLCFINQQHSNKKGKFMDRIEHINLVVSDIDATLKFIQTAFPTWAVRGNGDGKWYGESRNWLHVGTEDYYITLNSGNKDNNRDLQSNSPGLAHIGFSVDDVEAISNRLQNSGYPVAANGAEHPHRRTVYFIDPSGFEFEFIQYLSQSPELRKN